MEAGKMKKILILSFVSVVCLVATAGTQLLQDGSFEVWDAENPDWVYYWNVQANLHSVGTIDVVHADDRSLKIMSNSQWNEDGVTLNTGRNQINDNLSYNAGDTVEMSLMVNVSNWDAAGPGKGISFRLVANHLPVFVSDSIKETSGSWQQITGEYTFTEAFTGELIYEIRFDHSQNTNPGVTDIAYVDSASMVVVPEPATLSLLGIGAYLISRKRKI